MPNRACSLVTDILARTPPKEHLVRPWRTESCPASGGHGYGERLNTNLPTLSNTAVESDSPCSATHRGVDDSLGGVFAFALQEQEQEQGLFAVHWIRG
jgi:hypothetical protein